MRVSTSPCAANRRAARPLFVAYGVLLWAIAFSLMALPASAQVINVDFGLTPYVGASANGPLASNPSWNQFFLPSAAIPPGGQFVNNLFDDSGTVTTVDVAFGSGWTGSFNDSGPNNLQRDRAYTTGVGVGAFTISGLNPGGTYNLALITGPGASPVFDTDFTIGATTLTTTGGNAGSNVNGPLTFTAGQTHALFSGITASGAGDITFSATKTASSTFGVLSGLQIEGSFQAAPPLAQYWTFDDGVGTSAVNQVAGGNTGTLINFNAANVNNGGTETPPSDWVSGGLPPALSHSTGALNFEGGTTSGDYVDGGNINLSSTAAGGSASVSMWINPTSLSGNDERLFGQSGPTGTGEAGAARVLASGQVEIWNGSAWQVAVPASSTEAIIAGEWAHLAFVWQGGDVITFVDGMEQNTVTADFDFIGAGHDFGIGNRFLTTHGNTFNGVIDDLSIWNIALSDGDVAALASGVSPLDLFAEPNQVPEPASILMWGVLGLFVLAWWRRRNAP